MHCHKDLKYYRDEVTYKVSGCSSEYVNVAFSVENMDVWFHSCKNKYLICVQSMSSGVWCCVLHKEFTNILDEPSPIIFTFYCPVNWSCTHIWSFGKFTPRCTVSQSKIYIYIYFFFVVITSRTWNHTSHFFIRNCILLLILSWNLILI